jgi:hypothetical protein
MRRIVMASDTHRSIFRPIQLAAAASLGVLIFLLNLATGTLIVQATGIPVSGGFVMFFLFTAVAVFARLIFGRFGGATLAAIVFGVLGLGAPVLGPPGFFPKVIIVLVLGLLVDISFALVRNKPKVSSMLAGILVCYAGLGAILLIFKVFLPPQPYAAFFKIVPYFLAVNWAEGIVGGLLGWFIYNKLKDRQVVRRVQGE